MSAWGGSLLNRAINVLSFELHIPGYQFCGPGTRLTRRLVRGDASINPLDAACREHDIVYSHSNNLTDRYAADKVLADKALGCVTARDSTLSERAAVWAVMKAKIKISMKKKTTTRKKTTKKRVLLTAKRSGALPFLSMLGALGSLIGGAASIAKAVNDSKVARLSSKSNVTIAQWNKAADCISLRTNTDSDCISASTNADRIAAKKKKRQKDDKNAFGCNYQRAIELARRMHVPYFRGVFMHDALLTSGARRNENDIMNLDDATGPGTHWGAYAKRNNRVVYFNSFGNLRPPKELVWYFRNGATTIE